MAQKLALPAPPLVQRSLDCASASSPMTRVAATAAGLAGAQVCTREYGGSREPSSAQDSVKSPASPSACLLCFLARAAGSGPAPLPQPGCPEWRPRAHQAAMQCNVNRSRRCAQCTTGHLRLRRPCCRSEAACAAASTQACRRASARAQAAPASILRWTLSAHAVAGLHLGGRCYRATALYRVLRLRLTVTVFQTVREIGFV